MAYETPRPGEWVQPVVVGYKAACCDCCLVHRIDFRIHLGRIQLRVRRDNRATAALRRARRIRVRLEARP